MALCKSNTFGHKCSSAETGTSPAAIYHQTWWRILTSWPAFPHRSFYKVNKITTGHNLPTVHHRAAAHLSYKSIIIITQHRVIHHLGARQAEVRVMRDVATVTCFSHRAHQNQGHCCFNSWPYFSWWDGWLELWLKAAPRWQEKAETWREERQQFYKNRVKGDCEGMGTELRQEDFHATVSAFLKQLRKRTYILAEWNPWSVLKWLISIRLKQCHFS